MTDNNNTDGIDRAWASGALMGVGFTFFVIGEVTITHTIDPVGSLIVGALIFLAGWWLKRSIRTGDEQ